jgi:hypothetical protein
MQTINIGDKMIHTRPTLSDAFMCWQESLDEIMSRKEKNKPPASKEDLELLFALPIEISLKREGTPGIPEGKSLMSSMWQDFEARRII